MNWPERNHREPSLSTEPELALTPSERANQLRFRAQSGQPHVESHFLKGNSPDGRRALWVKYTILAPTAPHTEPVVELWAIAFRRDQVSRGKAVVANKQTFALREAQFGSAPFSLRLPRGELKHGTARGELGGPNLGPRLAWELSYACPYDEVRPYPDKLYELRFPRSKTLTPVVDSQLSGWFEVEGERWDVSSYRAAQGHNWGEAHAEAYAWVHGNAWRAEGDDQVAAGVWLEALTGRVKVGPVTTPWLSCAVINIEGDRFRFDRLGAMLSRRVSMDARTYQLTLSQDGAQLEARFRLDPQLTAGLRYQDPSGRQLACLNSKLAYGEVVLHAKGRTWSFKTDQLALELGTRRPDHGIIMLV